MATATAKVRTIPDTKKTAAKKDDTIVTVSSKYQIVIPKSVREQLQITPGQKVVFLVKQGSVALVPLRPIEELYGIAPGIDTKNYRDEDDDV